MEEHANVELMRRGYAAFGAGDMETVGSLFADDVTWHSPGDNLLSGDYRGKAEVFGLFGKLMELSSVFRQDIHDIVANDEHVVALLNVHAERPDGRVLDDRQVHVWHVSDGMAREFWLYPGDQAASDAFYS